MRQRRLTEAELIWIAYQEVPPERRRIASYEEMPETARAIWRDIVKKLLANGWDPVNPHNETVP